MLANPAWAPDGDSIAFDARHQRQSDVYFFDLNDDNIVGRISRPDSNEVAPTFSANGAALYFGTDAGGAWSIIRYDIETRSEAIIFGDGFIHARESSDGQNLYMAKFAEPGLHVAPVGSADIRAVDHVVLAVGDWGNWRLTESDILYVRRRRQNYPSLWRASLTNDTIEQVLNFSLSIPRYFGALAADVKGENIYVSLTEENSTSIRAIDLTDTNRN